MRALSTAATGMEAQQLAVEVISHNLANMNTTAFKRQRAEFQDLLSNAQPARRQQLRRRHHRADRRSGRPGGQRRFRLPHHRARQHEPDRQSL
jgi:flagellar basal body rod protein FlgG